jgi:hypothetical protein
MFHSCILWLCGLCLKKTQRLEVCTLNGRVHVVCIVECGTRVRDVTTRFPRAAGAVVQRRVLLVPAGCFGCWGSRRGRARAEVYLAQFGSVNRNRFVIYWFHSARCSRTIEWCVSVNILCRSYATEVCKGIWVTDYTFWEILIMTEITLSYNVQPNFGAV